MTGLRRYQIVIPLLLLFLLLSACRQEQKTERTSIVLLHGYGSNSERDRVMREIYKEFELQHPHISLHLVSVPSFDKVEAKTRDMLAVGKMPNIIYTGGYTTDRFYRFMLEQGYLTDLLPHIRKDADFHASLSPKIWQDWGEGEALYTVTDHQRNRQGSRNDNQNINHRIVQGFPYYRILHHLHIVCKAYKIALVKSPYIIKTVDKDFYNRV